MPLYDTIDLFMNILHLSTTISGGAGLAARRLNSELNHVGFSSKLITLQKSNSTLIDNEEFVQRSRSELVLSKLVSACNLKLSDLATFSIASRGISTLFERVCTENPDNTVIHVHNWFNLISMKQMSRLMDLGYKFVFTLHDQRMLTGGCHTTFECKEYQSGCIKCPKIPFPINHFTKYESQKLVALVTSHTSQISFISPSDWLIELFKVSLLNTIQIPTKIDNFFPLEDSIASTRQSNTSGVIRVGLAAVDFELKLKGGDLVSQLLANNDVDQTKIQYLFMGNFRQDIQGLESFWNSIDVLLVPSRSDNSPNVIHEAKIHGVPIIATLVGGIPELLDLDHDIGVSLENLSVASLLESISTMRMKLSVSDEHITIRSRYLSRHPEVIKNHERIYFDLLRQ